jgi:hypothetical protein
MAIPHPARIAGVIADETSAVKIKVDGVTRVRVERLMYRKGTLRALGIHLLLHGQ